jgi:parallel beta-helix repeat protein
LVECEKYKYGLFGKFSERSNRMRNKTRAVIEMTVGLVIMAGSVQAASTLINTCPFVITSPGRYLLAADLICGGGTGILITSSDVTLALEGHRITAGVGANMGFSTAISNSLNSGGILTVAPVARVSILGPGLITNGGENAFAAGVFLVNSVTQTDVNGITVLGSSVAGIDYFTTNVQVGFTTGLTFTANTLGRNGAGIVVTNVTSSTISNNDVSGNGIGISILNSPEFLTGVLVVSHNIVNGNTNDGVFLSAGGFNPKTVTVHYNVISGNGGNGIKNAQIAREITNNTALANGMFDLFDTAPGCTGTVWRDNKFFTANQSCIQ